VDTSLLVESADTLDVVPLRTSTDCSRETSLPRHVAVLEHDDVLRENILLPGLRRYGFEVETMGNTSQLQQALLNHGRFDLCVLDSVLSSDDGISLPQWLRSQYPQMGIVIFSSQSDPYEHLRGLKEGSDAYLLKPAPVEIVAETLFSLARRMQRPTPPTATAQWQLQPDGWCLIAPDGAQATLTVSERHLVKVLWEHNGALVPRDKLMLAMSNRQCSTSESETDPHGLDVLLYRLRRKVQNRTGHTLPLEVIRKAGYILHRQSVVNAN